MTDAHETEGIPFAATADRLASDYDVLMCYQVLLGRDPENSFVIQEAKTQPVHRIVHAFLRSDEFAGNVAGPFARGEKLAHDSESLGPSADQVAWLGAEFVLPETAAAALGAARTWRATFAALFEVPGLNPDTVPAAPPSPADAPPSGPPPAMPRLCGAVDSLLGTHLRGWCVDVAEPDRPVSLTLLADGEAMGDCDCRLFRGDVQAVLGGDGCCGFEFRVPEALRTRGFVLTARETRDGTPVLGPLPAAPVDQADALTALQARLHQMEAVMRQVTETLPALRAEMQQFAAGMPPAAPPAFPPPPAKPDDLPAATAQPPRPKRRRAG